MHFRDTDRHALLETQCFLSGFGKRFSGLWIQFSPRKCDLYYKSNISCRKSKSRDLRVVDSFLLFLDPDRSNYIKSNISCRKRVAFGETRKFSDSLRNPGIL